MKLSLSRSSKSIVLATSNKSVINTIATFQFIFLPISIEISFHFDFLLFFGLCSIMWTRRRQKRKNNGEDGKKVSRKKKMIEFKISIHRAFLLHSYHVLSFITIFFFVPARAFIMSFSHVVRKTVSFFFQGDLSH